MTIFTTDPRVKARTDFAAFLCSRGLTNTAVEVGTHRGEFARQFLSRWPGRFYCVDHWQANYDPGDPAALGDRAADQAAAIFAITPFASRATILNCPSVDAAARFENESCDFVYIDATHRRQSVFEDLLTWWPKVRQGGIIAGYDIVCAEPDGGWGKEIQPAVLDFGIKVGVDLVYLVPDPVSAWSFFIVR